MRFLRASVSALALVPFANLAFAEPTVPQVRPEMEQATKMLEAMAQPAEGILELQLQTLPSSLPLDSLSTEAAQERVVMRKRGR
jgi:hypothetical protein